MSFEKVNLLEICDFVGGSQPPKSDFIDNPKDGYVRLLQIRDFENNKKAIYIPDSKGLKKVSKNDVLLGRYGASVGKILTGKEGTYNVALMKVIPNTQKVQNRFLFYVLKSIQFQKYLKMISESRAAQAGFSKRDLSRFYFYLPDLYTQQKIYLKLDVIQQQIERRGESIKLLNKLIESIYFDSFGNPIKNTNNWKKKKLSSIGNWSAGGTPKTSISEYYKGSLPWFTSGELNDIFVDSSDKYITDKALKESNAKRIFPNTLMIGLYDTAAFKMSISDVECSCNQAILYSKINDEQNTLFVYYTLQLSKQYYLSKRKGARQKNLNSTLVKNIEIIYPTTKEQKELIQIFNTNFNTYYLLKQKNENSIEILKTLFQAVLQNAFNPNTDIDEKPIFKELIGSLDAKDIKGNKKRLQYLLELFTENKFDNEDDYINAKDKLFNLILENEIKQEIHEDKIMLKVK